MEKREETALKKIRRTSTFFWLLFGLATFLFILSNAESIGDNIRLLLDGDFWRQAPHRIPEKVMNFLKEYSFSFLWAYGIFIAGIIFLEERNPDRTIAWLLVLPCCRSSDFSSIFSSVRTSENEKISEK